eukprot:TRINITY_DN2984_c0_g1_i3.p2 TRINITY_DN2984_c0_g1~~TRINITY_DN2984_c0_g1_i3.p2  ORF type:complete len:359 (-),score=51.71 TRINITY_DN2984_c0_g1_i3:1283-2359(-)
MGSDIYVCSIEEVDPSRRRCVASLTPTGAGDYTIGDCGFETLFLMVLWERLPFKIRYREKDPSLEDEVDSNDEEQDPELARFGTYKYDCVDCTAFVFKHRGELKDGVRWSDLWLNAPDEEREYYTRLAAEKDSRKTARIKRKVAEEGLPGLAELSIDDIFGDLPEVTWKYIQHVREIDRWEEPQKDSDADDDEEPTMIPTAKFEIIVTHPKYLLDLKEESDGTTSYEQRSGCPKWSKARHLDFPIVFRLQTKILLSLRLPQHNTDQVPTSPTFNLIGSVPEPIFYTILSFLARESYRSNTVADWEVKYNEMLIKRIEEKRERAANKRKKIATFPLLQRLTQTGAPNFALAFGKQKRGR